MTGYGTTVEAAALSPEMFVVGTVDNDGGLTRTMSATRPTDTKTGTGRPTPGETGPTGEHRPASIEWNR